MGNNNSVTKKSYTQVVNSSDLRQYGKSKGLTEAQMDKLEKSFSGGTLNKTIKSRKSRKIRTVKKRRRKR